MGNPVTITGTGFTGATSVRFNGVSASFTVNSSTQVTTTVPSGATTGAISVETPAGTGTSATSFTVSTVAAPTISSISPRSGPVNTPVTITGTNLTGATSVKFGGGIPAATYTVVNSSTITTNVPSGAKNGPISVTTPDGTATSSQSFRVSKR